MQRLAVTRWRHHGQPMVGPPMRSPAQMGKLTHDGGTMLVNARRECLEIRDNVVITGMQLAEYRCGIWCHVRRAAEHGQRDAAFCLLLVIELVLLLRLKILLVADGMARAHHAVLKKEVLEPKRLKQRIVFHGSSHKQPAVVFRSQAVRSLPPSSADTKNSRRLAASSSQPALSS